jgi:hypothetical protein
LLVEKLHRQGHDAGLAEKSLNGMEAALVTMQKHRDISIDTIEDIERGLI